MEPRAKVEPGSGKHSVYTHIPKDPNCDICLKTKITRASCRRRAGTVVPRAEHFGDLITDHNILSEESESHNNHRYADEVQDLATQWILSYPCETKTSQETQKSLMKFLEPTRKPKVIYTDNSLEFGKSCEELSWNHCTSTPHRSETKVIAERAVRRVKEWTSAMLLQSGLDKEWWTDSMECYCYLRNIQDLLSDGKTRYERRFGMPFKGPMVDEQPTKRSKKNDDKSAVAILKKGDWEERGPITDQYHDRPGNLGREVIRNWDKIHLNVNFLMHGNWVAFFRT